MKAFFSILFIMILFPDYCDSQLVYPKTAKEDVFDTYFGVKVAEPYRWLENDTSRDPPSPKVTQESSVMYNVEGRSVKL